MSSEAADALRAAGFGAHDVVVVLGSGWQSVVDSFGAPTTVVHAADVPGFVAPVAEGHGADIASYSVGGRAVLVLTGRTHLYEGHGPGQVAHGVRTAAALGCRLAILTNANGSLRAEWPPGTCVLVRDHLNLTATSPLVGGRFVDLTDAYSTRMRGIVRAVAPEVVDGVYAMLPGPHYETAAEAAMLKEFGADVVGMSTVLETIAAREAGMEVLALSMVTVTEGTAIDPAVVVAVAASAATAWGRTLVEVIGRWEP